MDGSHRRSSAFAVGCFRPHASCTNPNSFYVDTGDHVYAGCRRHEIPVNYCTGPAQVPSTYGYRGPLGLARRRPRHWRATAGRSGGGGGVEDRWPRWSWRTGWWRRPWRWRRWRRLRRWRRRRPWWWWGGGGGFGGGRGSNTGRRYNLSLGLQALNLFNEVPYGSPVATVRA